MKTCTNKIYIAEYVTRLISHAQNGWIVNIELQFLMKITSIESITSELINIIIYRLSLYFKVCQRNFYNKYVKNSFRAY